MSKIPAQFTGTGDLFSSLLLAWSKESLQVRHLVYCAVGTSVYCVLCICRLPVRKLWPLCIVCYKEQYDMH